MDLEQHKTVLKNMNLAIKDKPDWYLMQALQSEAVYLAQEFPEETKTALKVIKYAKSWAIPLANSPIERNFSALAIFDNKFFSLVTS